MQLQFQSHDCRCLEAAVREVQNTELTQDIRLGDAMPDIGRVLTAWGQVILRSKQWQADQITVAGGVMAWILYAPEDGTPPRCVDTWVPFQLKWEVKDCAGEGPIRVYPLLRFVDSRSISARKMILRIGVAAFAEALVPVQRQIYSPADLPADIQVLKNTYPIRLPREAGEKTFLIDEQLPLPSGAAQPERLLAYGILPQIQEKRVAGDKMILRGNGKLHVVYRCDQGKIHALDMDVPLSQYAQLEADYGPDAQADIMMGVTSLELGQSQDAQLRLKCGVVAQYLITDRYLAEVVEDIYSLRRKLEFETESLSLPSILEQRTEILQMQQKLPAVHPDVVDVTFFPDFSHESRRGDLVTLDIPGQFQLLYYEKDGSLQGSTARGETSFQTAADPESAMNFLVMPHAAVQTVETADEITLSAQIKLEMQTLAQRGMNVISGLEMGPPEEPDPQRPSLIICRQASHSLWEIAKQCGATVDDIRRINCLDGEADPDKMLLIPIP